MTIWWKGCGASRRSARDCTDPPRPRLRRRRFHRPHLGLLVSVSRHSHGRGCGDAGIPGVGLGHYAGQGGALWAAEADGQVVGMIATRPLPDNVWEVCRVYVRPMLHGSGLGQRLLDTAEVHAVAAGADAAGSVERHAVRAGAPLLRETVLCPVRSGPGAGGHFELAGIRIRKTGQRNRGAGRRGR